MSSQVTSEPPGGNKRPSLFAIAKLAYGGPFRVLGIFVGSVSLFNFSLAAFHLPLGELFKSLVAGYRSIFHPIADFALFWLPWSIPPTGKDVLVLWALTGMTLMRWMTTVGLHDKPHMDTVLWRVYAAIYYVYFILLTMLLGPILLAIYFWAQDPRDTFFRLYCNIPKRVDFPAIGLLMDLEEPAFEKSVNAWVFLLMFLSTIAGCAAFIVLNAFFGPPAFTPSG